VAASASPTVRRRLLAAELRRLRGVQTGGAVARALSWSPAKISRYELGQTSFPLDEVEKLLDFYGVAEPRRGQLLTLAAEAGQRGWWEEYSDVLAPEFMEFIGLEAEADWMTHWQVGVIPGLLQTEEYARQLNSGYHSVIPNRVAELPNVDLRVLPLMRETSLVAESFAILAFGSRLTNMAGKLADVVSTEGVTSELYVEGESDTYLYRLVFQGLLNASLSPADSRHLIRQTAERLWT
jgi:hypothetical protein